jgi:sarcosine oxidase delta subunit
VLDNFLLRLRLIGVSSQDVESYLYADENDVRGYFFENWDQLYMKTQGRDEWLTAKVAYLTDEYNRFLKEDLSGQIRKYKVDYIYAEDPFSEKMLNEISGISVATSTENFILYRLDSPLSGN